MSRLFRHKKILSVVVFLMVAGFLVAALEMEGGHQNEVHHCVNCCVSHHVAAPVPQANTKPTVPTATFSPIFSDLLYNQVVLKPPAPPPKFIA